MQLFWYDEMFNNGTMTQSRRIQAWSDAWIRTEGAEQSQAWEGIVRNGGQTDPIQGL